MDKRVCRVGGMVIATGIGLALSTGQGVAVAKPSASDSSEVAPPSPAAETGKSEDPARITSDGSEQHDEPTADDDSDRDADELEDIEPLIEEEPDEAAEGIVERASDRSGGRPTDDDTDVLPPSPTEDSDVPIRDAAAHKFVEAPNESLQSAPPGAPNADDVIEQPFSTATGTASPPAPEAAGAIRPVGVVTRFLAALGLTGEQRTTENPLLAIVLAWARRLDGNSTSLASATGPTSSGPQYPVSQPVTTINVKDYGAAGDGVTDDSAAIKAAEAALTSNARLYFPEGDYRFAQQNPAGGAAVALKGLSNVTVEFAPGARLLMDNLAANGHGTGHGLRVEGAASHVTILNANIEWVTRPSARSFGDGISVLGWPSNSTPPSGWSGSTGTVEFISIVNTRIVNAPQAGVVVMGASDVTVTNMTAIGTLADGLHLNANRRVTVDGLVAQNTGDDGLAFVTYYHPTQPWTYGPNDGPFNQSGLGEWNNSGSTATHITVIGGSANGFRVQGGYGITISQVTVSGTDMGFQVNSSIATGPGDWTSLASRNISISDVTINDVNTGIVLGTHNIDGTEDAKWWDFSGLQISDVTITGARNWSVAVETPWTVTSKFAGVTLTNIYAQTAGVDIDGLGVGGNGGMLLASLRDSLLDNITLASDHAADIYLFGSSRIRTDVPVADLPSSNLTVGSLTLVGPGKILIQDIAGLDVGTLSSSGAAGAAVELYRVKDATFDRISVENSGRGSGDGYGVRLLQVRNIDVAELDVTMDAHIGSSWCALQVSAGNPSDGVAGDGVRIDDFTYTTERNAVAADIDIQGGPWGATNWYVNAYWRHEGAPNPHWASYRYGDISPASL